MNEVKLAARGSWRLILTSLGVDVQYLKNRHGPCPGCGGTDRYRFDDKDGDGCYFCSGCGAGDGFDLLKIAHGWGSKEAFKAVRNILGVQATRQEKDDPRQALRDMWGEQSDPAPVVQYFNSRGLLNLEIPASIGYHYPTNAMIAKVADRDGKAVGIHRTFLETRQKKFMPTAGVMSHVALYEHEEVLGVAEGIETAIAACEMFGVPVWATLSTSLMAKFCPPENVKKLIIFGDNDANYAGHAAAYQLAHKVAVSGFEVEVKMPGTLGDWLDVLNAL